MKNSIWLLSMVSLILLSSVQTFSQGKYALDCFFSYYYFDYSENVPHPLKSTETGWLPGGTINLSYHGKEIPIFSSVKLNYTSAKTTYDGTTQGGAPITLDSKHTLELGEFDFGYSLNNIGGSQFSLTPYSGIAYRYWERMVGDTDPRGLREVYSWWHVPVGLQAKYSIDERWTLACEFSARFMFGGEIKFDFNRSDPTYNSPTAELGSETGWKLGLPIDLRLSEEFLLKMEPWYEYSSIGKSNEVYITENGIAIATFYEPSSQTYQYGVNIGVGVEF